MPGHDRGGRPLRRRNATENRDLNWIFHLRRNARCRRIQAYSFVLETRAFGTEKAIETSLRHRAYPAFLTAL